MRRITAIAVLVCSLQYVSSLAANLNPPNGSVVARMAGAINSASFECDVFHEWSNGTEVQQLTTWTIQNFRSAGDDGSVVILQSNFEGIFLIGGTLASDNPFSETYRNRLAVLSFVEDLDRAVLSCGTANTGMGHFNLRVYRPPLLASGLVREVVEGMTFSIDLSLGVEAFPYPSEFQWRKNGIPIGNTSLAMLGYPVAEFQDVSRSDSGNYSLGAVNYNLDDPRQEIGRGTGAFQLEVFYGPDFIRGPDEVAFVEGSDAILLCGEDLASNPPAIITWSDNEGNHLEEESTTRVVLEAGPSSVSLTLRGVGLSDAGDWTCSVEVEHVRTTQHSIALTVIGPPSEPQSVIVVSSGPTWAYLMWEEPDSPGSPPTSVKSYVVVATRSEDGSAQLTPATDLSVNVTGLLPNTDYRFSVIAQSAIGEVVARSLPSALVFILTTTTVPEIECPAPPLSREGVVNVTWQYIHTGGLNLSQVTLLYSPDTQPLQFQLLSNVTTPMEGAQTSSAVLRQLPAGNAYIFEVVSSNAIGSSSAICPPVNHDIGVPQTPVLYEATSSRGEVSTEMATAEPGTFQGDLFQFNVRAVHTVTLEERNFTFEVRQYTGGTRVAFVLTGFTQSEQGSESVYNITASCSNRFGVSEESNTISVIVLFSTGVELLPVIAGIGAAAVVLILVMCLLIICFGVHHRRKSVERRKRRYSPARHTNGSLHSTPVSIPRSTKSNQLSNGLSHHFSSTNSIEKAISLCTSIPTSTGLDPNDDIDHAVYDTLAPPVTTTSLPPSSPRVPPQTEHLNHSTGDLGQSTPVMRGANSRGSSIPLQENRRSNSVPDISEQVSPDFPAGSSKPISINRDLLEIEGYISMLAARKVGAAGGRQHSNGHAAMICAGVTRPRLPVHDYDSDIDDSDF